MSILTPLQRQIHLYLCIMLYKSIRSKHQIFIPIILQGKDKICCKCILYNLQELWGQNPLQIQTLATFNTNIINKELWVLEEVQQEVLRAQLEIKVSILVHLQVLNNQVMKAKKSDHLNSISIALNLNKHQHLSFLQTKRIFQFNQVIQW